jgi:hypothetical protein
MKNSGLAQLELNSVSSAIVIIKGSECIYYVTWWARN